MTNRGDAVFSLFEAALELPEKERAGLVSDRCRGDEELRDEVLGLLAADARAGQIVIEVPMQDKAKALAPGDRLGVYEIRQIIGEGGFAFVYFAQQTEPVSRRVAVKTLKPQASTPQVVARFLAERQALALMDHPNIAKVFDSGLTDAGLPYFAMEYVEGESITEHCDTHRLSIRERLELVVQCCEAVQHAHRRAVIHRDLKPSNILVTRAEGRSIPKIIDFGVAKAIDHKLTPDSIHTQEGAVIGTPAYMSPEQVGETQQAIDTRADVYALGVIMYEVLTDKLPFDSRSGGAGLVDLLKAIRELDAPRPSTMIETTGGRSIEVASKRQTEPTSLARSLRGDLDWIVLTALAKDRDRRYGSPMSLAEDIGRYLTDQPVLARPPSVSYRARKLVRRNPATVVAAGLSLVFVVAFAVNLAVQAARDRRASDELAKVVAFQAQRMRDVEVQSMGIGIRRRILEQARAASARIGPESSARTRPPEDLERLLSGVNFTTIAKDTLADNIFTANLEAVSKQFADQPLVKARLLQSLAYQMQDVGLLEPSVAPQEEALAIRRRYLGPDHPDTLTSIAAMGELLEEQGKFEESEPYLRAALEGRRRDLGPEHPQTLVSMIELGDLLFGMGRRREAEPYLRAAIDGAGRVLGPVHPRTLEAIDLLLILLQNERKLSEAEKLLTEVLQSSTHVLGSEHPAVLRLLDRRASLLFVQGRLAEAEDQCRAALALHRRVLGDEHPKTLDLMFGLATVLGERGALDEAEAYLRQTLQFRRKVQGETHPRTFTTRNNLAHLLHKRRRYEEAATEFRALARLAPEVAGPDHPEILNVLMNLAGSARALGRLDEAERTLRDVFERSVRAYGKNDHLTLVVATKLGDVLNLVSRFEEAERLLRGTFPARAQVHGADHWRTLEARSALGHALAGLKRFEEAERELLRAYAALDTSLPSGRRSEVLPLAAARLVFLYTEWNRPVDAEEWRAKSSTQPTD